MNDNSMKDTNKLHKYAEYNRIDTIKICKYLYDSNIELLENLEFLSDKSVFYKRLLFNGEHLQLSNNLMFVASNSNNEFYGQVITDLDGIEVKDLDDLFYCFAFEEEDGDEIAQIDWIKDFIEQIVYSPFSRLELGGNICNFFRRIDLSGIYTNSTSMVNTFTDCTNLVEIRGVPNRITNVFGAFNGCKNLERIEGVSSSLTDVFLKFEDCIN